MLQILGFDDSGAENNLLKERLFSVRETTCRYFQILLRILSETYIKGKIRFLVQLIGSNKRHLSQTLRLKSEQIMLQQLLRLLLIPKIYRGPSLW